MRLPNFRVKDNNDNVLLNSDSIELQSGLIYSLSGQSGSGKSLTLEVCTGYFSRVNSTCKLEIDEHNFNLLKNKLKSWLPQNVYSHLHLLSPLREQLISYIDGSNNISEKSISVFNLFNIAAEALGVTSLSKKILPNQLSGGMLQRFLLITAILRHPKFLLLDEPVSHLDPINRLIVHHLISKYCSSTGAVALWAGHDQRLASLFNGSPLLAEAGVLCVTEQQHIPKKTKQKAAPPATRSTGGVAISVQSLNSGYYIRGGIKNILDAISYNFHTSRIYGLIGPSGCGKTTFLNTLANRLPITKGHIENKHLERSRRKFCAIIQYIEQDSYKQILPNITLRDALNEPLRFYNRPLRNDKEWISELEKVRLSISLDRPVGSLSYGQKQRLLLVRIIRGYPDLRILLLDEPFSGLDSEARDISAKYLMQRADDLLIIVASHETDVMGELCDEVIYMQDGRIEETSLNRPHIFKTSQACCYWDAGTIWGEKELRSWIETASKLLPNLQQSFEKIDTLLTHLV